MPCANELGNRARKCSFLRHSMRVALSAFAFAANLAVPLYANAEAEDCSSKPSVIKAIEEIRTYIAAQANAGSCKERCQCVTDQQLKNIKAALFDAAEQAAPSKMALCSRSPVDRIEAGSQETLLTEAVKSGSPEIVNTVVTWLKKNGGDLDAINGKCETAYQLAPSYPCLATVRDTLTTFPEAKYPISQAHKERDIFECKVAKIDSKSNQAAVPSPNPPAASPNSEDKKKLNELFSNMSVGGSSDPVAPDRFDNPKNVPAYVINLLGAQQGISFGSKTQNGSSSPQVQGEIRYSLDHPDIMNKSDRVFAFLGGNINKNANPQKPTVPDWVAGGLGYKLIADLGSLRDSYSGELRSWWQLTGKAGFIDNKIPATAQYSRFLNVTGTYNFPLWANDSVYGRPIYGAATIGTQFQNGGSVQSSQTNYDYARFDVNAYVCWWEACKDWVNSLGGDPFKTTFHFDRQVVDRKGGHLLDFGFNFAFLPRATLGITRTIGNQDPLTMFGIVPARTVTTQVQIKLQP